MVNVPVKAKHIIISMLQILRNVRGRKELKYDTIMDILL
jgi:hypothetical protein